MIKKILTWVALVTLGSHAMQPPATLPISLHERLEFWKQKMPTTTELSYSVLTSAFSSMVLVYVARRDGLMLPPIDFALHINTFDQSALATLTKQDVKNLKLNVFATLFERDREKFIRKGLVTDEEATFALAQLQELQRRVAQP